METLVEAFVEGTTRFQMEYPVLRIYAIKSLDRLEFSIITMTSGLCSAFILGRNFGPWYYRD